MVHQKLVTSDSIEVSKAPLEVCQRDGRASPRGIMGETSMVSGSLFFQKAGKVTLLILQFGTRTYNYSVLHLHNSYL